MVAVYNHLRPAKAVIFIAAMDFLKSVTGKIVSGLVALAVIAAAISWWQMEPQTRHLLLAGSGKIASWFLAVLLLPWATFFVIGRVGKFESNFAGAALVDRIHRDRSGGARCGCLAGKCPAPPHGLFSSPPRCSLVYTICSPATGSRRNWSSPDVGDLRLRSGNAAAKSTNQRIRSGRQGRRRDVWRSVAGAAPRVDRSARRHQDPHRRAVCPQPPARRRGDPRAGASEHRAARWGSIPTPIRLIS